MYCKKSMCMLLILLFFLSSSSGVSGASDYTWGSDAVERREWGEHTPFRPCDMYVSEQNPPSFWWTNVKGASGYDIMVCTDAKRTDVKYYKENIKFNYYNFDCTFEEGVNYFWAVRYTINGVKSSWSEARRRFRIKKGAYPYPVESADSAASKIPKTHPRVLVTSENKEALKNLKDDNPEAQKIYKKLLIKVRGYISANILYDEPVRPESFPSAAEQVRWEQNLRTEAEKMYNIATDCGFLYQLTDNGQFGEFGKAALIKLAEWDPEGATSYESQSQVNRAIAYNAAMAYDWLYDLLKPDERKKILDMIRARTEKMIHIREDMQTVPFNSMGWTMYGFIGIIYYATFGDIPEAEERFKDYYTGFTSLFMPWSYQDGGSAQGTGYWASTQSPQHEFMQILALSGTANLYNSAWERNSVLYQLYAYPNGSWGSFGDGGMEHKAGSYFIAPLASNALFTKNPVAKWLQKEFGEISNGTGEDVGYNDLYVSAMSEDIKPVKPDSYPLSHLFKDIGIAVMTDSLTNPDRVQLTFRSSEYGSYNHAHPDQNAFYIQAFGEKLAVQGGHYDYFGSTHHKNYARKTYAHNTITVDGGKGQPYETMSASGKIKQFVNHIEFDSVTGDASEAYKGNRLTDSYNREFSGKLKKYVRNIIYVRPGMFITVDDLEADDRSEFEWWLNGKNLSLRSDNGKINNTAVISNGDANLAAKILFPQNTSTEFYNGYYTPNGEHFPTATDYGGEEKRMAFVTPKCNKTKMVAAMDVYKSGEGEKNITTEYAPDNSYMKLVIDEKATVIINLGDENSLVSADGFSFRGVALSYSDNSVMLTNGTYLEEGSKLLYSSTQPSTYAIGYGRISISAENDCRIYQDADNARVHISCLEDITDEDGNKINEGIGIEDAKLEDKALKMRADRGNYELFNGEIAMSPLEYTPKNVSAEFDYDTGMIDVQWDQRRDCIYNLYIDGTKHENVNSPFAFSSDEEKTVKIQVEAEIGSITKKSEILNYYPQRTDICSHIAFEKDGNKIGAKVFANIHKNTLLNLVLAKYDESGALKSISSSFGKSGIIRTEFLDVGPEESVKSFLWNKETLAPVGFAANYGSGNTDLEGIYLNGKLLDGFDNSKGAYTISLKNYKVFPVITAKAADGASKVNVFPNNGKNHAKIVVAAQDGTKREVKLNFSLADGVRPYISNYQFLMPKTFSDIDADLLTNCTDTASGRYEAGSSAVFNGFTSGGKAFSDRDYAINKINELFEPEGCIYLAPSYTMIGGSAAQVAWQKAYYFGCKSVGNYKYPEFEKRMFDFQSFDLNTSADIYVATYGNTPMFIDGTWEKLDYDKKVFRVTGTEEIYTDIYVKHVNVGSEPVNFVMKTPGTGSVGGMYITFIKPVN